MFNFGGSLSHFLVGDFNPSEKYARQIGNHFPRNEKKRMFETTTWSFFSFELLVCGGAILFTESFLLLEEIQLTSRGWHILTLSNPRLTLSKLFRRNHHLVLSCFSGFGIPKSTNVQKARFMTYSTPPKFNSSHLKIEPRKNPALLSMKYWVVDRDPYNGLL